MEVMWAPRRAAAISADLRVRGAPALCQPSSLHLFFALCCAFQFPNHHPFGQFTWTPFPKGSSGLPHWPGHRPRQGPGGEKGNSKAVCVSVIAQGWAVGGTRTRGAAGLVDLNREFGSGSNGSAKWLKGVAEGGEEGSKG